MRSLHASIFSIIARSSGFILARSLLELSCASGDVLFFSIAATFATFCSK